MAKGEEIHSGGDSPYEIERSPVLGDGVRRSRRSFMGMGALGLSLGAATVTSPTAANADSAQVPPDPMHDLAVNVLDYGAEGDGTTDDADAFRAAMAALGSAGGGLLVIPPRTYLVNKIIVLVDNVHIYSSGATLTKTQGPHEFFVSLSGKKQGYGSGVRNVKVEGITFRGSFDTPYVGQSGVPIQAGVVFALHHAQDVVVERCLFIQMQGTGHHLDLDGSERITVRDCVFAGFDNFKTSGYNKEECIELDQSRVYALSYPDDPASYDALFTRDVRVENCAFLPVEVDGRLYPCGNPIGAHGSREGHRYENITFTGNLVVDPIADPSTAALDQQNTSASWKGVTHFPTTRNLVIENNTFIQHHQRPCRVISVFSIDVSDLNSVPPSQYPKEGPVAPIISENIIIANNRFIGFQPPSGGTPQEVIWLHGVEGGPVRHVTVRDNTFSSGQASDGTGTVAIRALRAEDVTIAGNSIIEYTGGVELQHTSRFHVFANTITTGSAGTSSRAAIQISDDSDRGFVTQNITEGFTHAVTRNGAGAHNKVIDNL